MNYIEKVETEFETKFVVNTISPIIRGNTSSDAVKDFIIAALTDFVNLANGELEKMKQKNLEDCRHKTPRFCDCCLIDSSHAQSTLSRLLSGEVEK